MNVIAAHQKEIADRLSAFGYFSDIHVFVERQGDLAGKLDESLAGRLPKNGKIGVSLMVGVVRANVEKPDVPGPWFDSATVDVTVFEAVLLNTSPTGTGKACVDVAVMVARVMHQYCPGVIGGEITATKEALRPLGEVRSGIIAYKITLGINPDCDVLNKVQRPVISHIGPVPQNVELSCDTVGSEIYYTIDGSYPWSGNTNAVRYDNAPITILTPCTLRVVAHLAGWSASDAAHAIYE